ncbi:ABC transporter substrate-binding protein [Labrys monachus]|uniref:Multiple sugar transport system substrate-binding protein n=1 Tax=Labrys monachus TaxID=217067 RepID=A0ABU0FFQ4_9HYPH|nr:ABC transporter substrate-binding protein [Labrys monachus]MDQ0393444.1 multiple sugar transport system substrate-binding protein [Labrys monachus]
MSLAETVTLNVQYAWPSHKRFHEPLAAEFMKLHPDIKINFLAPAASYTDGQQRIMRSAITGNLPDIWYSGYSYLGELARKLDTEGNIADLGPFLAAEGEGWVGSNYSDTVLKLGQVDGKQWGLPFTASTPIIYYNDDLLKAVGESRSSLADWEGVIRAAKKIADTGGADGMSYAVNAWGDDWLWQALILNNGGRMLKPDGRSVAFGDESGRRAVRLIRRFVTETKMPFLDEDQSIQQFAAGKLGIFIGSTAEVRVMGDAVGAKFHFGTAPYPAPVEGPGGLAVGGSAALILAKDPAKRKAAWEFLKFATGPAGQKIVVLGSGYMPTNLQTVVPAYLGDFYAKNADWTTSVGQWPLARPWAGYPGTAGPRIWDEQKVILSRIMRGETTPDDGLKALVDVTNRLSATAN